MKKSNVTFIAAILIAVHAAVFIAIVGNKGDKAKKKPAPEPQKTTLAKPAPKPVAKPKPEFKVPELQLAKPEIVEPEIIPVDVVEPPQATPRETIANTSDIKGYLSANRPNRRTSKVYSNLIGDPYQGAIVVDARTGRILYEDRAAVYAYPASITKLMTMLVVLEQIDKGLIHLNDKVAITKEGVSMRNSRPSQVFLDTRESGAYTVHNLLQALIIHSACDAAQVLAIHVAGSRTAFIDMMNQRARELGMNSTTFHTEHGLPPVDGSQPDISTAYDIAILSLAVLRHPKALEYTGATLEWLPTSSIRKEKFMLANRNALVGKDPYPGCDGLKTGYHAKGGFSLAATAKQGDDRVIAVVLGVADRNSRNATVKKMLDKGFSALKQTR